MLNHSEFVHLLSEALLRRLRPTDLLLPEGATFCEEKSARDERFLAACQPGIVMPVIVDQNLHVIDGVRRCIASLALAQGTVPCALLAQALTTDEQLFWRCRLNPDRLPLAHIRKRLSNAPFLPLGTEANSVFSRLKRASRVVVRRKRDDSFPLPIYNGGKIGTRQAEIASEMLHVLEQIQAIGPISPAWELIQKTQQDAMEQLLTFRLI